MQTLAFLQSCSRPPSAPSTPVIGAGDGSQRSGMVGLTKVTVAAFAALIAALLLLHSASSVGRLQVPQNGSGSSGNLTDLYLRERGPLYLHAAQRCRAPSAGDDVPQLQLVASWDAPQGRAGGEGRVTLATQLSLERLAELELQCRAWPHALAAAIYAPLLGGQVYSQDSPKLNGSTVEGAQERLGALHERMAQQGACQLALQLYVEQCADESDAGLYPFNAMRNRALRMVATEAVLLLDSDLLPSRQFGEEVGSSRGWAALRQQLDLVPAVVLPAFQPTNSTLGQQGIDSDRGSGGEKEAGGTGQRQALQAADAGKDWVARQYRNGTLREFPATPAVAHGGACTRYTAWAKADGYSSMRYTYGCEPYVVMLREHVPWFDERFRGYGFDRMIEFVVMWQWGVRFAVHPRAFLVHVPHPAPKTREKTQQLGQGAKLQQFVAQVRLDLEKHRYYPITSFEGSCLLRPSRQHRRRNHIHAGPA